MTRTIPRTLAVLLICSAAFLAGGQTRADTQDTVYVPVLLSNTGSIAPSPTEQPQTLQHTPIEEEVAALINAERAVQGLPALETSGRLIAASRGHSQDMADEGFFSHVGSDGSTLSTRLFDQGYEYLCCGEIIAAGFPDGESVVNAWLGSSGHRAIILADNYTELGVGYVYSSSSPYGYYWTVDVASPRVR